MVKKKAATDRGSPLSSTTNRSTHHNTHQTKSASDIMVALYRVTDADTADYFDGLSPLQTTADEVLEVVLNGILHWRMLNGKIIDQLSNKLHKACDDMALGVLVDVKIITISDHGETLFGMYRKPTAGDHLTKSILIIAINRSCEISQIRLQPNLVGIERMASAFGMGVPYVH